MDVNQKWNGETRSGLTEEMMALGTCVELEGQEKLDAPLLYLDGPDYEKYVNTVYQKETVLIDKLKLRELMR